MESPRPQARSGGVAAWSIRRPRAVLMLALSLVVLGAVSLESLSVDLLPHIIYPEVRVRILDEGVPATVMEDRVTRQLEEQLAITEDAISVQSRTSQGLSRVDLSFPYGKDIDIALRDASTRLDRAKRFLPDTLDAPVIYKRDPAQIPVAEFVISSALMEPVALRTWVDYQFSKWFLNLPGVAAVEVGGGTLREIRIEPDLQRLAAYGLSIEQLISALKAANVEAPAGSLRMRQQQILGRTSGRFRSIDEIRQLPLSVGDNRVVRLKDVAAVIDGHEEEQLRVRYNQIPGIKVSIQKQPSANTVDVVMAVQQRIDWLREQGLLPNEISVNKVTDQSVYVRHALSNASMAAISGAILAMLVVYLFLGNLRRTLIIGSAIPIAIMVTFMIMNAGGLTLNIMSLGGLALGVGMLVDNTIVMLENIYRHQKEGESGEEAGTHASAEIFSAIMASTSTNLAAVLPFLFIGGLVGLLFKELIFTISAAILASLLVAVTLVPTLAARVRDVSVSSRRKWLDQWMQRLQEGYARILQALLSRRRRQWILLVVFSLLLLLTLPYLFIGKQVFLPQLDEGEIRVSISTDPGTSLEVMDKVVRQLEALYEKQQEVEGVFTIAGGRIFGRTETITSNRTSMIVRLRPVSQRALSSDAWIRKMKKQISGLRLAGVKVRMRSPGIRGVRTSRGDDDISIRIQGPDLDRLKGLAEQVLDQLRKVQGLRNLEHSAEDVQQELSIDIDRERAARLGLSVEHIGTALRLALEGRVVSDFLEGDVGHPIRVRLPREKVSSPADLSALLLFPSADGREAVYLRDVAGISLASAPVSIMRENQMRIVEVSASLTDRITLDEVAVVIRDLIDSMDLPPGYLIYDGGTLENLNEGRSGLQMLLLLALFLVFVVMTVQYESLRNPAIIMMGVPFAVIGVAITLWLFGLPLSMPVWLGLIMLAGIVVNNAIVLVEYIEQQREIGKPVNDAIIEAGRLRLRPILMTTLTTVVGMLPLAVAIGQGTEMLQPLAITIVSGLSFSLMVSLLLIPILYQLTTRDTLS